MIWRCSLSCGILHEPSVTGRWTLVLAKKIGKPECGTRHDGRKMRQGKYKERRDSRMAIIQLVMGMRDGKVDLCRNLELHRENRGRGYR